MYKIIGADQKEYGPVSSVQIRQWIAEGRVNAETRARAEGGGEWKPLGTFSEFADVLGTAPAMPPLAAAAGPGVISGSRAAALKAVNGPSLGLIITSILNVVYGLWQLVAFTIGHARFEMPRGMAPMNEPEFRRIVELIYGPLGIGSAALALAITVVILVGAIRMRVLRNYPLAITGAILAVVPCFTPCCLICLPFGIWALVVLNRPEVKSQFS